MAYDLQDTMLLPGTDSGAEKAKSCYARSDASGPESRRQLEQRQAVTLEDVELFAKVVSSDLSVHRRVW